MQINFNLISFDEIKLCRNSKILVGESLTVLQLGLCKEDTLHFLVGLKGGGFPGLSVLWEKSTKINIEKGISRFLFFLICCYYFFESFYFTFQEIITEINFYVS